MAENNKNDNGIPPFAKSAEERLRKEAGDSVDLNISKLDINGRELLIVSVEGMAGSLLINELIAEPVEVLHTLELSSGDELIDTFFYKLLTASQKEIITRFDDMLSRLYSGFAVIIADGSSRCIAVGAQGYVTRGISSPVADQTVYGPQEAFNESIRISISMIRRRLKTPKLCFEQLSAGELSGTDICIAYIKGRANERSLSRLRARLSGIKLDTVLSCGYIRPFIEKDYPLTLFSPSRLTERPDTVCAALNEGRMAVLVDGTPFCIIIPTLFSESFTTPDDMNAKPIYVSFIKWLKYLAFFLATLFPGLYAAAVFEPEGFAFKLLLNLYSAEESSQFPLGVEIIIITVLLEILREAGIRLPRSVGSAVSIVGGLIIGDAAVKCGIISAPLLILVGLTATASFVIPEINAQTSVIRILFIISGALAGMTGLACALALLCANICAMDELSSFYTEPVIPLDRDRIKDVLWKRSMRSLERIKTIIGGGRYDDKA